MVVSPLRAWEKAMLSNSDPSCTATYDNVALAKAVIMITTAPVPKVIHHLDSTRDQLRFTAVMIPVFSTITKQMTNHNLTIKNISIGIPIKKMESIVGSINTTTKTSITPVNRKKLYKE